MSTNELLLNNYIEIGTKVEILAMEGVMLDDGTFGRKKYQSVIMDLIDDEHIEMMMPIEKTKLVLLQQDAEYELHFITPKGLYQCLARVTKRYKNEQLYLLEMELVSNIQKYQRREYYRYSCSMDIGVRELNDEESRLFNHQTNFEPDDLPFAQATTVDISGGGIRFISSIPFETGEGIVCRYELSRNGVKKTYSQIALVLACNRLEKNNTMYELRVKFTFINNNDREEIIRYIFEEERKRRQSFK